MHLALSITKCLCTQQHKDNKMLKHISEYLPEAVKKLTGQELADLTVRDIFPPKSPSIFGNFSGDIQTFDQMQNILDIADITRDVGAKLSPEDQAIEKRAFNLLSKYKKG